ncbi:MAG: SLC13 family permease [Roseburia sp.]|nr:SLC13 family permease [Roseburia sp.]
MWASVGICIATCVLMILSVLFFPKLKIGKIAIDTYWLVTLVGAAFALAFGGADVSEVGKALVADTAINPVKILVLFLSMTFLSIYLDGLGFFRFLASVALKHAGTGQKKLFFILYFLVSVLTVFTSNDIIILSFTPFICYFAKNAKVSPVPYLAAEFVAANTWSMALIIGNPTNIYLATASGVGFLEYVKFSIFPTLFGGAVALGMLFLLFRRQLKEPLQTEAETVVIEDKLSLWVGIAHLAVCTVLLAIGSYINIEMWLVALCAAGSLIIFTAIISAVKRQKPAALLGCLKRTPYQLVPFVLSMFVMIVVLADNGVTRIIGNALGENLPILKYGVASFFAANLINNIPMSVLFSSVISSCGGAAGLPAVFATVIGSNVGAFFTPLGALAGIMWGDIIGKHGVKFGYLSFLKIGVAVAVPTLFASLGGLWLATAIFL